MKTLVIGANDAGQRLDKFLAKAVPLLPKALLYKYIRIKRIKLDDKRCEISTKLTENSVLSLYINDEFFAEKEFEFLNAPSDINVLYEDENILLADKPFGLVVHEDESGSYDTLINRIQHYLYNKSEFVPENENCFAPALCNRIDRNTGGIVIAAKNFATLTVLNEKIKSREIEKSYICLVYGKLKKDTNVLKGYHTKDSNTNTAKIYKDPVPGCKTALTKYTVIEERGDISLLEIELLTGRTHQIRAHMASIGHPIVGDTKYGVNRMNTSSDWKYQALYSYKLLFKFISDAKHLNYLKNKIFEVKNLPF